MELHMHKMSGAEPSQGCSWAVSHCRYVRIPEFRTWPAPYPKIPLFAFPWRVQRAPFRFAKSEAWQMTELHPQPQHSDYSLGDLLNKALPPFFSCFNGILRNFSQCPQGGNLHFFYWNKDEKHQVWVQIFKLAAPVKIDTEWMRCGCYPKNHVKSWLVCRAKLSAK